MITSDKSDNNYFPASSEFSHIVAELERYIETPEESSLTFNFKVTSILTPWLTQFAYWAYSYSQNCITIKLLNKDLKVYNEFGVKSDSNFILLDDIKLFALTMNRFEKFNLYGFVEQEICRYILNKIKNKPKELILSTSTVKSKLRSNYLSLKQIQDGELSQTKLREIEDGIVNYLSTILLQKNEKSSVGKSAILPLRITNIQDLLPQFEKRLTNFLADSNKQLDYNLFIELKGTYQLSDDFLKLYLDELLKSSKRKTYYVIVTEETYKFLLELLWNNKSNKEEFEHYCKILLNEIYNPQKLLQYWKEIIPTEQFSIVSSISNEIELKRE